MQPRQSQLFSFALQLRLLFVADAKASDSHHDGAARANVVDSSFPCRVYDLLCLCLAPENVWCVSVREYCRSHLPNERYCAGHLFPDALDDLRVSSTGRSGVTYSEHVGGVMPAWDIVALFFCFVKCPIGWWYVCLCYRQSGRSGLYNKLGSALYLW